MNDDLLVHSSFHSEVAVAFAGAECSHNWCMVQLVLSMELVEVVIIAQLTYH